MRDPKKFLPRAVVSSTYGWSTHLWKPVLATATLAVVADAIASLGMLCTAIACAVMSLSVALRASGVEDRQLGPGPILPVLRRRALPFAVRWLVRLASAGAFVVGLWAVTEPVELRTILYACGASATLMLLALWRASVDLQGSSKKKQAATAPLHSA